MKIATTYPGATLHGIWSAPLASAEPGTSPLTLSVFSLPSSARPGAATTNVAGLVVPLTAADLMTLSRAEPHLHRTAPGQFAPALVAALPSFGPSLEDFIKFQHPGWTSELDPVVSGFAIIASSAELYSALKGKNSGLRVLAGAKLGANILNVVANTGVLGGATTAVHGVCFVVNTASSLTKVVLDAKGTVQR